MSKFILTSENNKKLNVKTDIIMQQNNYKKAAIEEAFLRHPLTIKNREHLRFSYFIFKRRLFYNE